MMDWRRMLDSMAVATLLASLLVLLASLSTRGQILLLRLSRCLVSASLALTAGWRPPPTNASQVFTSSVACKDSQG